MNIPLETPLLSLTYEEIFGMPTGDLNISSILNTPENYAEAKKRSAREKIISRSPETWLEELLKLNREPAHIQRYIQQPPTRIDDLLILILRPHQLCFIISKGDENLWNGLDKVVPGWAGKELMDTVFSMDNILMFEWLTNHHPALIQRALGITPSDEPVTSEKFLSAWQIQRSEPQGPQAEQKWGAQKFLYQMDRCDEKINNWIWENVAEAFAYKNGNPMPWAEISRSQYNSDSGGSVLGEKYLQIAAGAIDKFSYLVHKDEGPEEYLSAIRPWLDCPLLQDESITERLIPFDSNISKSKLALSNSDTSAVHFLLGDPATSRSYIFMLRMKANGARKVSGRLQNIQKEIGWTEQDFMSTSSKTHGLVEAAMLVGKGAILERLLIDPKGISLIQKVLKEEIGPRCLVQMGTRIGWRNLGSLIIEQAEAWRNWSDRQGNTISHWLSFAYNKIDDRSAWTAHQDLTRVFPEHVTISNSQHHEPTTWMPRIHSKRISEQMIRKAGRLTVDERKSKAPTKQRKL